MKYIKKELKVRHEELVKVKTDNRKLIEFNEKLQADFDNSKIRNQSFARSPSQSIVSIDRDSNVKNVNISYSFPYLCALASV